jgi:hypothetical protein
MHGDWLARPTRSLNASYVSTSLGSIADAPRSPFPTTSTLSSTFNASTISTSLGSISDSSRSPFPTTSTMSPCLNNSAASSSLGYISERLAALSRQVLRCHRVSTPQLSPRSPIRICRGLGRTPCLPRLLHSAAVYVVAPFFNSFIIATPTPSLPSSLSGPIPTSLALINSTSSSSPSSASSLSGAPSPSNKVTSSAPTTPLPVPHQASSVRRTRL